MTSYMGLLLLLLLLLLCCKCCLVQVSKNMTILACYALHVTIWSPSTIPGGAVTPAMSRNTILLEDSSSSPAVQEILLLLLLKIMSATALLATERILIKNSVDLSAWSIQIILIKFSDALSGPRALTYEVVDVNSRGSKSSHAGCARIIATSTDVSLAIHLAIGSKHEQAKCSSELLTRKVENAAFLFKLECQIFLMKRMICPLAQAAPLLWLFVRALSSVLSWKP
jgi:hypothetical protein